MKIACQNPSVQKIATGILSEIARPAAPELSMGDHLMASQLKSLLNARSIEEVQHEDLIAVLGNSTEELREWLLGDPKRIAHAIRLAYELQTSGGE